MSVNNTKKTVSKTVSVELGFKIEVYIVENPG